MLRTTLNASLRIAFKKTFHMNTDILYITYDLLIEFGEISCKKSR